MMTITETDSGKTLHVAPGIHLCITLNENPTTGYRWISPHFDPLIISLESNEFSTRENNRIGEGGLRKLVFFVNKIGSTQIKLENVRGWERDVAPKRAFEVMIVVQ